MRCKKHYTDLSSSVGVCASCLRERLFYLVLAQKQSQSLQQDTNSYYYHCNSQPFPRSVSPYITRRKSDNSAQFSHNQRHTDRNNRTYSLPDHRFFSTPQLAPTTGSSKSKPKKKKKYSFIRFSLLSNLFRSKKQKEDETDPDPDTDPNPRVSVSVSVTNSRGSCGTATSAMSSPFWFSNMRSGNGSRKMKSATIRKPYCSDRGMSPVRYSDYNGVTEDEFYDGSSGYETCESRKQTPWRTPVRRSGGGGGYGKNVSGLAFCLSPLVRASPCRQWSQKGTTSSDGGGDIRTPAKAHLANTKSFCANRSRKLADFGRSNTNR